MQYVPSVEDTVLGVVVDTKPDVSIFPPILDICPGLPWKLTKEAPGQINVAGSIGPWTIPIN